MKDNREYRSMELKPFDEEQEYRVSGYASTFDPYVLF